MRPRAAGTPSKKVGAASALIFLEGYPATPGPPRPPKSTISGRGGSGRPPLFGGAPARGRPEYQKSTISGRSQNHMCASQKPPLCPGPRSPKPHEMVLELVAGVAPVQVDNHFGVAPVQVDNHFGVALAPSTVCGYIPHTLFFPHKACAACEGPAAATCLGQRTKNRAHCKKATLRNRHTASVRGPRTGLTTKRPHYEIATLPRSEDHRCKLITILA